MYGQFSWFVGIDWGSERHQVCVLDKDGAIIAERSFAHSGVGLETLCDWLSTMCQRAPRNVAVVIDVPHGSIVETLIDRGVGVFVIPPRQLDRFRDRFASAGAKDDRRDARATAASLRTSAAPARTCPSLNPPASQDPVDAISKAAITAAMSRIGRARMARFPRWDRFGCHRC